MLHARPDYQRIQDPESRIPEKEPVFLLRGQDVSAPATLRFWAQENRKNGGEEDLSVLAEAQALRMEQWPQKKPADS